MSYMRETEFRWLRGDKDELGDHEAKIHCGGSCYMVLQMRQRVGPVHEDWFGTWKDIPVTAVSETDD
jgi:hypothetical protein